MTHPFTRPVIPVAVVTEVVLPPLAVSVVDHRDLAPHAHAPNTPANASEGICTHASSS